MAAVLDGKVAVVTGSGGGIGEAIAVAMAEHGARVVVNDLGGQAVGGGASQEAANRVVQRIRDAGGVAIANYDSVATMQGAENIIKTALDSFGRIDILVNNAGIDRLGFIWEMTEEDWDQVLTVHLKGTWACCKFASVPMRDQQFGRIINVSSENGLYGSLGQTNYSAAKAGIIGLSRALAMELWRYGVTVNVLCPRATTRISAVTRAFREKHGVVQPEERRAFLQRVMDPAEVPPIVVYLASDGASSVTSQVFQGGDRQIGIYAQPGLLHSIHKKGIWTQDELAEAFPNLAQGMVNPATNWSWTK